MKVDALYWNRVVVSCEDPSKRLTWGRCWVRYGRGSLSVTERDSDSPQNVLYGRAELVSLDATRAVFRAFWWSAHVDSTTFDELVPVEVTCEF